MTFLNSVHQSGVATLTLHIDISAILKKDFRHLRLAASCSPPQGRAPLDISSLLQQQADKVQIILSGCIFQRRRAATIGIDICAVLQLQAHDIEMTAPGSPFQGRTPERSLFMDIGTFL